jgi:uncharacterized protein DUF3261
MDYRRMKTSKLILYCFVLLLSGCSLFAKLDSTNGELVLLPPSQGPEATVLKQVVTVKGNGEESSFLVVSKFEPEKLGLVALLPTGQSLLSLDYDGLDLTQQLFAEISLPSEEMLAIMQFALWPGPSIKQHYLRDAGWLVTIDSEQRTLSTLTEKILTIRYQQQTVLIEHHLHQYKVIVRTIEKYSL